MSTVDLSVDEYRALLAGALPPAQDADTIQPSITSLFTPDKHRRALDVDATVVRGGRGVGPGDTVHRSRSCVSPKLRPRFSRR